MFDNVGKVNDEEAMKRRAASIFITIVVGSAVAGSVALYGLLTVAKAITQVQQDEEMVEVVIQDPEFEDAPPPPPPPPPGPAAPEEKPEDEPQPEEMSEVVKELDQAIKEEVKADVPTGGDPAGVDGGQVGGQVGGVVGGEIGGEIGGQLGGYKTMHHSDVEWKFRAVPDYPDAAREMNLGDIDCRVRMYVDEKGMPNNIDFVACPKVFQETAKEAFFKSRWYPAKVDNAKTKAQFVLIYQFKQPR